MKSIFSISTIVFISFFSPSPIWGQWQGVGIEQNPYKISSVKDLVLMVNKSITDKETFDNVYFELTEDIDLSSLSGKMRPIGDMHNPFRGTFDGAGHTISNLSFNTETLDSDIGLFGGVTGVIKNLNLAKVNVIGNARFQSVGALVGILNNGVVKECSVTGKVVGKNSVGGLVGHSLGTVSDSYFIGEVYGISETGGLLGGIVGTIRNCYFRGIVKENGIEVDKIIGKDNGMNSHGTTVSKFISCNFIKDNNWQQANTAKAKASVAAKPLTAVIINDYDTDFQFCDGMLAIRNNELKSWGFINETGKLVINYQWHFDPHMTPKFNSGNCAVFKLSTNGLKTWYILDKSGNAIKVPGAVKISQFQDGFARAVIKVGNAFRHYYINSRGIQVFPSLATTKNNYFGEGLLPPRPLKDGLIAFQSPTTQKYGFMDKTGVVVVKPIYEEVLDFSEGLAAVKTVQTATIPSRFGYINTKGEFIISPKFQGRVLPFSEGFASVEKGDKTVVIIDKTGNVVSPAYADARQFYKGFAFVRLQGDMDMSVIDKEFKIIKKKTGFYKSYGILNGLAPLNYIHDRVKSDSTSGGVYDFMGKKVHEGHGVGPFGDNLYHIRTKGKVSYKDGKASVAWSELSGSSLDAFVDYEGNYVIVFVKGEF